MSENIFTPGPWEVRQHGNLATFSIVSKNGDHALAVVGVSPGYIRPAEDEGNARLIAAAPAMYESLQNCVNLLRHLGLNWFACMVETTLCQARGGNEVSK